jgi:NADH-quinone oxidoreductase subunit J
MNLEIVLFIVFGGIAASTAVIMITRKNPIVSALFLVLNFASLAGIYLVLNAQFIAVVQIIVYAGAIMVLFLFVIMLLRPENEKLITFKPVMKTFAIAVSVLIFIQLAYLIFFTHPGSSMTPVVESSIKAGTVEQIGRELFTNYVLPFEAAGFFFLLQLSVPLF